MKRKTTKRQKTIKIPDWEPFTEFERMIFGLLGAFMIFFIVVSGITIFNYGHLF